METILAKRNQLKKVGEVKLDENKLPIGGRGEFGVKMEKKDDEKLKFELI